ncbi:MAG TPA: NYN domain-containing protein [Thermoanaerobaculia bacterium]|nr:NYN domain-containing protein [Thermoanaerobaculia bacterium]
MSYLIDGSNLLGRSGIDREGVEAKRSLLRALGAFVRAKRTRATCYFDGPVPEGFAWSLGAVTAVFSEGRPADDLIVDRIRSSERRGWKVVTSDQGLASKVEGRRATVIDCRQFRQELESVSEPNENPSEEDWTMYFSDAKNRNIL